MMFKALIGEAITPTDVACGAQGPQIVFYGLSASRKGDNMVHLQPAHRILPWIVTAFHARETVTV
jgi:hypothetical protein